MAVRLLAAKQKYKKSTFVINHYVSVGLQLSFVVHINSWSFFFQGKRGMKLINLSFLSRLIVISSGDCESVQRLSPSGLPA